LARLNQRRPTTIILSSFDDLLEKKCCLFSEWTGPTSQWHFQARTNCLPSFKKELHSVLQERERESQQTRLKRKRIQAWNKMRICPIKFMQIEKEREGPLLVCALKTMDNLNPHQGPEHWMVTHEPPPP